VALPERSQARVAAAALLLSRRDWAKVQAEAAAESVEAAMATPLADQFA